MDSDDQNFNKKCDIDIDEDDDDVLVDYKVGPKCCDKINSNDGNQCLDANGNQVNDKSQNGNGDHIIECDCEGVKIDSRQKKSTLSETNSIHQIDENIVKKLQTIALSDYGKLDCSFPIPSSFSRFAVVCRSIRYYISSHLASSMTNSDVRTVEMFYDFILRHSEFKL